MNSQNTMLDDSRMEEAIKTAGEVIAAAQGICDARSGPVRKGDEPTSGVYVVALAAQILLAAAEKELGTTRAALVIGLGGAAGAVMGQLAVMAPGAAENAKNGFMKMFMTALVESGSATISARRS